MAQTATRSPPGESRGLLTPKEEFAARAGRDFDNFLLAGGRLALQTSKTPRVTVVLVLWNKAELTYLCLRSLAQISSQTLAFDVLVIDNASTDRTQQLMASVSGARYVRNEDNVGFLKACNQAMAHLESEYVLLLNNDTEVFPGSIEAAVAAFEATPSCGAVGARIMLTDGTLQEAGNIVWSDGTCVGYGRGWRPLARK